MKTIWLKDLKLKEEVVEKPKRKPLFLWMKEKDIYRIEYFDGCIYWYNKDWLKKYYEDSDGYWSKTKYKDWKETYFEDSNKFWSKRKYKHWLQVSYEDSNGYLWKVEEWKKIEYKNWKYYIDWEEAELIHR